MTQMVMIKNDFLSSFIMKIMIISVPLFIFHFSVFAQDSIHKRNGERLLFPGIFYKPETRLGVGFGELVSFSFNKHDSITRFCKIIASQWVTQNKQLIFTLVPEIYTSGNKYFIYSNCQFWRFPNRFYAIGCNSPNVYEHYNSDFFAFRNIVQRKIGKRIFVGIIQKLKYFNLRRTENGGMLSKGKIPGSQGGMASGAGLTLNYDTRDNIFYPYNGSYHQFQYVNYSSVTGSEYHYNNYFMDMRRFIRTYRYHVLALQLMMEMNAGQNVPFFQMAQIGGGALLRGYFNGRFYDRHAALMQAEYRVPVWRRVGVAGFAGAGEVADKINHYSLLCLKPSAGMGLRFRISDKEKVNARLDYGWGKNTSGLYFEISEAF